MLTIASLHLPARADTTHTPTHTHHYATDPVQEAVYWLLGLLTGGLLLLVCKWHPALQVWLRYTEVAPADPQADIAMVTSLDGERRDVCLQTHTR